MKSDVNPTLRDAFDTYSQIKKSATSNVRSAKRRLVSYFTWLVELLLSDIHQAHDLDLHIKNNIDIAATTTIVRMVDTKSTIKRGTVLVDHGNEDLADGNESVLSVPVDNTWIVVEPWESIIFIDESGEYIYHYNKPKLCDYLKFCCRRYITCSFTRSWISET